MLETLFSSRVRAKVLAAFFLSPGGGYNAWELAQTLRENYSAVWKELVRLEGLGILKSERMGNSKYYQINQSCPIVPELRLIVLKTKGVGSVIREQLQGLENVNAAFIYGSFASGEADARSDIDLLIVGEMSLSNLAPSISKLEKELNRPINYLYYSNEEWNQKKSAEDPFWENVTQSPKIMLIGEEHVLLTSAKHKSN